MSDFENVDISSLSDEEAWTALLFLCLTEIEEKTHLQWEEYKKEICHHNRFFPKAELLSSIEKAKETSVLELPLGEIFYRARIINDKEFWDLNRNERKKLVEIVSKYKPQLADKAPMEILEALSSDPLLFAHPSILEEIRQLFRKRKKYWGFSVKDSDAPPSHLATAGRANPQSISYLYLCSDINTAILEVNPRIDQMVSVATVRIKEPLRIYDMCCSNEKNITREAILNFDVLSREFSKPNWGNNLDYIPTQYLCEYIKELQFDGLRFSSSLNSKAQNIVLFDTTKEKKYTITQSRVYAVSSINIETNQIAPFEDITKRNQI